MHDCTVIMRERYSDNNDINKDGTILYIEQEGVAYNCNAINRYYVINWRRALDSSKVSVSLSMGSGMSGWGNDDPPGLLESSNNRVSKSPS